MIFYGPEEALIAYNEGKVDIHAPISVVVKDVDENGNVVLGDEMLTPDSSRFWPLEGYEAGKGQPSFDKQYVRDWLKANPDNDFLLPEEVVTKTVDKYKEAFALLTGKEFK